MRLRAGLGRACEHLGEPDVALQPLGLGCVDGRRLDPVDELTDRPLLVAVALWALAMVLIVYTAPGVPIPRAN